MRSKRQNESCIICQYTKFRLISSNVRDSKNHKILRCKNCEHVQLFPIPSETKLKKFNDENLQDKNIQYYGKISDYRSKSIDDTKRRAKLIKELVSKDKTILEIGSGHGFFLEIMKKNRYNIMGIEVSKEKRKLSKKIVPVPVLDVDLTKNLPEFKVDVIVMFHVLEHLPNPIILLENLKKMMKPHGKLVIEVPNLNDLQLELENEYREWYWQLAHISYFTPKILKKLLRMVGFQHIRIFGVQRYSVENMFNWKLLGQPQLANPTYHLEKNYEWLNISYKKFLEKKLLSDTLIAVASR